MRIEYLEQALAYLRQVGYKATIRTITLESETQIGVLTNPERNPFPIEGSGLGWVHAYMTFDTSTFDGPSSETLRITLRHAENSAYDGDTCNYQLPVPEETLAEYKSDSKYSLTPIPELVQGWAESMAFSYYNAHEERELAGDHAEPDDAANMAWAFAQDYASETDDVDFNRIAGMGCPPAFTHHFGRAMQAIREYKALEARNAKWATDYGYLPAGG